MSKRKHDELEHEQKAIEVMILPQSYSAIQNDIPDEVRINARTRKRLQRLRDYLIKNITNFIDDMIQKSAELQTVIQLMANDEEAFEKWIQTNICNCDYSHETIQCIIIKIWLDYSEDPKKSIEFSKFEEQMKVRKLVETSTEQPMVLLANSLMKYIVDSKMHMIAVKEAELNLQQNSILPEEE